MFLLYHLKRNRIWMLEMHNSEIATSYQKTLSDRNSRHRRHARSSTTVCPTPCFTHHIRKSSITELRATSNTATRLLHYLRRTSNNLIIDPTMHTYQRNRNHRNRQEKTWNQDQGMEGTYEGLSAPWNQSQRKPHPGFNFSGKLEHVFVEEPP